MPIPLPAGPAPRPLPQILCLALAAAGCRAAVPAGSAEPALEARALAPFSYEAEICNRAVSLAELSELDTEPEERVEARADDVVVDVNARLVALSAAAAESALGWSPQERTALIVDRAQGDARLSALLAQGSAAELSAPRLSLVAGYGGYMTIADQVAYVERFELVSAGQDCIADPAVGVAEEGFMLKVHPERPSAEGVVPLALELIVASLEQPMRQRTVKLPGTGIEVSLQTPLSTSHKVATEVQLGPDDLLILGGVPADGPDAFLFLFATCDVLATGTVQQPEAPGAEDR